jgi:hypothetical protein
VRRVMEGMGMIFFVCVEFGRPGGVVSSAGAWPGLQCCLESFIVER